MVTTHAQRRASRVAQALGGIDRFMTSSTWAQRRFEPGITDFTFGNPHEMPIPGFVDALQRWSTPLNKDWFAYKVSEDEPREVVSASLRKRHGLPFEPGDIAMTNGGFGAIATALRVLAEPGDEVIYSVPSWFFYEPMILEAGLNPITVRLTDVSFDLDLEAIERAITPRTRIVVINSPHNPTGRIYSLQTLQQLAAILRAASERYGEPIYLLSDEPYRQIVFDAARPAGPVEAYPHTLIAYSYGKILLTPGQRIGYLAMSPQIHQRERLRGDIMVTQMATGWMFPNALLQHAIADIETLSIDIDRLRRRRDTLVAALRGIGYEVHVPDGTFYLLPQSPLADDAAFTEILARHDIFVLPGSSFDLPGYFRICLTATDEMVERSLSGFAAAWQEAATLTGRRFSR